MSDMRDDIASVLLSAEDIQKRTAELGARISKDFDGREPLFVGVLKGCFVFMADLMRSVTIPCSVDFMAVSSYGNQTTTTGAVKINKDLNQDIEGRDIILVEDILDSGVTLHYLADYLSVRRPASITIAARRFVQQRRNADRRDHSRRRFLSDDPGGAEGIHLLRDRDPVPGGKGQVFQSRGR